MRNRFRIISTIAAAALWIFLCLAGRESTLSLASQDPAAPSPRNLERKYDPIKVKGEFLKAFRTVPISRLALVAFKDGKISPIPFQIDERNAKGLLVMTGGKTASHDDDNGLLDANDELVFIISDAADRLPEAERADKIEIEVTDPRYPGKHAWAYLVHYKNGNPPRSSVDYVSYNPATESIISKNYILGYRKGFMFYNDLIYPVSAGGNGKDFIDRIKVRFKVDFLKGKMKLERNEDFVKAEVTGWIDGPVRVVQSSVNHVKLFEMFPPISFDSMSEYFPDLMASPITVRFPFDLNKVVKMLGIQCITADVYGDMPGLIGGKGYTNLYPQGFDHTGHMPLDIFNKIPKKGIVWGYVTKKGVGTWFPRVIFPDPMYQFNNYYLKDDVNFNNPPEDVPGEIAGGIRLIMTDYPSDLVEQMGQESFMLKFETYFARPGITSEEAREWLDIQDYPLLVQVRKGKALTEPQVTNKKANAGPPWKGGCDGTITDMLDRKISLKRIAFFIGDIDVDARTEFGGVHVEDSSYYIFPISTVSSMENYCREYDPYTKTRMALFSKIQFKNGDKKDLMTCRACGWAGADDEGRVVYLSNAQIKRIDF